MEDEKAGRTFRVGPILAWPLLAQAYGMALILIARPLPMLELTLEESAGFSSLYTILVLAGAYLILYLLRKGLEKVLIMLFSFALFVSSIMSLNHALVGFEQKEILSLTASAILVWLCRREDFLGNFSKVILSSSASYVMMWVFPEVFVILSLLFLAVYDAYSVFKGPIARIFSSLDVRADTLSRFFIIQGEVGIGMGDMLIYSLASSTSLKYLGLPAAFLPVACLNLGIVATLRMLFKRKAPFPGITLPVALWSPCYLLIRNFWV